MADHVQKGVAVIDWLSFTFDGALLGEYWVRRRLGRRGLNMEVAEWEPVQPVFRWLDSWGVGNVSGIRGNGLFGFESSVQLYSVRNAVPVCIGVVAWGGKNQRGRVYVSLDGTGCSKIRDWVGVVAVLNSLDATITRVDVASDDLEGADINVDKAADWYGTGGFNAGGRKPKYRCDGDWLESQGSGRTLYVGSRRNGKLARVYEKGLQLGAAFHKWTRFEVELHNTSRIIPIDILLEPSKFFAGCYPCCQSLVNVGAERIRTLRAEAAISLDRLKNYCKIAYGKLLNVLRNQELEEDSSPGRDTKILEDLIVGGVPRRLEKVSEHLARPSPGPVPVYS